MKVPSLRAVLLLAVILMLTANVLWRLANGSADRHEAGVGDPAMRESAEEQRITLEGGNIMPSFSNLASMGRQWQRRINALPPEQRAREQARLDEEEKFFVSVWRLPTTERERKIRGRLEFLMNDPTIQAEWAAERHRMIARLASDKRRAIFRNYVQTKEKYKSQ